MKDDLVEQCRAKARITRSGRPSEAEEAEAAFFDRMADRIEALEAQPLKSEPPADVGYRQAWQEIADLLDIPAQAVSPREVHEQQIMPRLRAALAAPQQGEAVEYEVIWKPNEAGGADILSIRGVSRTPTEPEGMVEQYEAGWNALREALEIANPGLDIKLDGRARYRLRKLFIPRAALQETTRDDQGEVLSDEEQATVDWFAAAIRNQSDQEKE